MHDRRSLRCSTLLCVGFCAFAFAALGATAQQTPRVPRIGFVANAPWRSFSTHEAFLAGMRDHGYVEGRDYIMEARNAEGKAERFTDLSVALARLRSPAIQPA